ncbi:hypothetical protein PPERSA_10076 [Pseudocohnilembus persalinus]|uniref:Uncharacterized protein n=1 Tax=Pseudocohnilembus persalinus TaxID=266149 RepID=A0A0V0QJV6_PSEPJ|nr:hypothetical protein PPERSA_10076 [Pseudocohnilembus persalinus]|eukprot:KRX02459.1 hypothetical protein PPERSA_10076 [Pseudocohnilembus persalinus]
MENLKEIQIKNQNINLELTKENRKLAILEGKIQSLENQKETLRQNLKSYNIGFLQKQIDTKAEAEQSNQKKLEQFINAASLIKFYNNTIFQQVQDAKKAKLKQEQDPYKIFPLEYDEYIQNRTETMKKYSQDLEVLENKIIQLQNQLKEQDNLEDKLKNYEQLRIKDEAEMQNVLEQLKQLKINKKDQKQIQKNLQYQQEQVQKKILALRDEIDDLLSKNDDIINKINDQCSKYQTHFHAYKSELLWSMPKIDKKLISKTNKFISIISEL